MYTSWAWSRKQTISWASHLAQYTTNITSTRSTRTQQAHALTSTTNVCTWIHRSSAPNAAPPSAGPPCCRLSVLPWLLLRSLAGSPKLYASSRFRRRRLHSYALPLGARRSRSERRSVEATETRCLHAVGSTHRRDAADSRTGRPQEPSPPSASQPNRDRLSAPDRAGTGHLLHSNHHHL